MRKWRFIDQIPAVFFSLWLLSGCAAPSQKTSLYQELGEKTGIEKLVETFLYRLSDDMRIVERFANSDINRLHYYLSQQICALSDGPCKYEGRNMRELHQGMSINRAEFNALVEDLILAMEDENIPVSTQNKLLKILAPLQKDVVMIDIIDDDAGPLVKQTK